MFKQYSTSQLGLSGTSQLSLNHKLSQLRHINRRLIATAATCVVFVAAAVSGVNAQYKGYKKILTRSATTLDLLAQPSYDIDQCANLTPGCQWVNGELGHQNSSYTEGDSVPFRVKLTNLTVGETYTYTINWDATDNPTPNHGYDYLTSYNRTVTDANVCDGQITGCPTPPANSTGTPYVSSAPIPIDDVVRAGPDGTLGTADDVTQIPGRFWMFGGDITGVSGYTYTPAPNFNVATKVSITITFVAQAETVVLAWGGHISTRADWGDRSAIGFSGSPYHMRNGSFCVAPTDCKGGNADLQIKVSDVLAVTAVRVIKDVNIVGRTTSEAFSFASSTNFDAGGLFALRPDGVLGDDRIIRFVTPGTFTISETLAAGSSWSLTGINCTINAGGGVAGTAIVSGPQVTLTVNAGNFVSCTYVNTFVGPTAAHASLNGRVATKAGVGIRGALVTILDATTGETKYAVTNTFGYYNFSELPVEDFYVLNVSAKRYTFSENSQQSLVMHEDAVGINFTSDQ
jgi:hypothetical protein